MQNTRTIHQTRKSSHCITRMGLVIDAFLQRGYDVEVAKINDKITIDVLAIATTEGGWCGGWIRLPTVGPIFEYTQNLAEEVGIINSQFTQQEL